MNWSNACVVFRCFFFGGVNILRGSVVLSVATTQCSSAQQCLSTKAYEAHGGIISLKRVSYNCDDDNTCKQNNIQKGCKNVRNLCLNFPKAQPGEAHMNLPGNVSKCFGKFVSDISWSFLPFSVTTGAKFPAHCLCLRSLPELLAFCFCTFCSSRFLRPQRT